MLKSVEDINPTKKRLKIEIPPDMIEREIKASLEKLRHTVRIPGFRAGKAPVTLIEKRFGKKVEAEVLDKIIPEQLSSAIQEAAINPVALPVLDEEFQFERNNPVTLSITVEIMPKIENLSYENISIKDIPFTVEESDMEDALNRLREQKAVFEVADKEIEADDFVSFEYVDSEMAGGEVIPSAGEIISKMGNEIFPVDIMEMVIGKKKGDVIEFTKTFDKGISKELAGKTARVKIRISEVKNKVVPSANDEFAKDLGYETLSELREKIKERLHAAKQEHMKKIQKAQIIDKIIESNPVEVPEILVQRELEALVMQKSIAEERRDRESLNSVTGTEETSRGSSAKPEQTPEELEAELRRKAVRNVQAAVIINAIGREETLSVSDDEVNERISAIGRRLSASPEAIRNFYQHKEGSMENLKQQIFEDKVMDMLLARASIEKGD